MTAAEPQAEANVEPQPGPLADVAQALARRIDAAASHLRWPHEGTDVVQAIWLAAQWSTGDEPPPPPPPPPPPVPPPPPGATGKRDSTGDARDSQPPVESRGAATGERRLLPTVSSPGATTATVAVPVPGEPLAMVRAIRPVARRGPSVARRELDIDATVRRITDEGIWELVLRPVRERIVDLSLVCDVGPSMTLWRETLDALRSALETSGTFRSVRTHYLDTETRPCLIDPASSRILPQAALTRPSIRNPHLILVCSDCVSPAWRRGEVAAQLSQWMRHGTVVLAQTLPEALWDRTALGWSDEHALLPVQWFAENRNLQGRPIDRWASWGFADEAGPEESAAETRPLVPVTWLDPAHLHQLAAWLAGNPARAAGYRLATSAEANKVHPPRDASELVRDFRQGASRPAVELATCLAVSPLVNLPIMRLIARDLLGERAGRVAEAELWHAGLLRRAQPDQVAEEEEEEAAPLAGRNQELYDFAPGVREELLDALPRVKGREVMLHVSQHIEGSLGRLSGLHALLVDPTQAPTAAGTGTGAWTPAVSSVLNWLGGDYAAAAQRLQLPAAESRVVELTYSERRAAAAPMQSLEASEPLSRIAWSPRGNLLAAPTRSGQLGLWRPSRKDSTIDWQNMSQKGLNEVSWSGDDVTFATACHSHKVLIHRVTDPARPPELLTTLGDHNSEVRCSKFSPDGKWLVTGTAGGTVRFWDPQTFSLLGRHWFAAGKVRALQWLGPSALAVATAAAVFVLEWESEPRFSKGSPTAHEIRELPVSAASLAWSVATRHFNTETGPLLIAGTLEGQLQFWDVAQKRLRLKVPCGSGRVAGLDLRRVAEGVTLLAVKVHPASASVIHLERGEVIWEREARSEDKSRGGSIVLHPHMPWVAVVTSLDRQIDICKIPIPALPTPEQPSAAPETAREKPWAWVCVAGSGVRASRTDVETARAVGRLLADLDVGLIAGGWQGVDEAVAESFGKARLAPGKSPDGYFRQIGDPEAALPLTQPRSLEADEEWYRQVLEEGQAVILIGGHSRGGAGTLAERALTRGIPVFPLRKTKGDAGKVHQLMLADWERYRPAGLSREQFLLATDSPHKNLSPLGEALRISLAAPQPPQPSTLPLREPVLINRNQLREHVRQLAAPGGPRVLIVEGPPGSGKSYSLEYIRSFAQSAGGIRVAAFNLLGREPDDIARSIGSAFGADLAAMPQRKTAGDRWGHSVMQWVMASGPSPKDPLWLVIDDVEKDLSPEIRDLILALIDQAAIPPELGELHIILLGSLDVPAHLEGSVLRERISSFSPADALEYVRQFAQSHYAPIPDANRLEQWVKEVFANLPPEGDPSRHRRLREETERFTSALLEPDAAGIETPPAEQPAETAKPRAVREGKFPTQVLARVTSDVNESQVTSTGFLVGGRLLMTAAHVLFQQRGWATQFTIEFPQRPGMPPIRLRHDPPNSDICRVHSDWSRSGAPECDIGVIFLPEPMGESIDLELAARELKTGMRAELIGYGTRTPGPSEGPWRAHGQLVDVERRLVRHNMPTLLGSSGSPLLVQGRRDRKAQQVAAVHVSKSQSLGVAVRITPEILELVKQWRAESEARSDRQRDASRPGYDEVFLGKEFELSLPRLTSAMAALTARRADLGGDWKHSYVLSYAHFSIVMHRQRRLAFYAAANCDFQQQVKIPREASVWVEEPRIDEEAQLDLAFYRGSEFDRRPLARWSDVAWGSHEQAQQAAHDTMHLTNTTPLPGTPLTREIWPRLAEHVAATQSPQDGRVSVFTGHVFLDSDPIFRKVKIPQSLWRIVAWVNSRNKLCAAAFVMQHDYSGGDEVDPANHPGELVQTTIQHVEALSGLTFDANLTRADFLFGKEPAKLPAISALDMIRLEPTTDAS
ncbi:MAG TPA: SAV_2336 N-terminal domain-related protein [Pirellulaceae bacterium]|nr:SAV_2336 N-terminal domain-related protein [Pirellulaceae bacterium]